MNDATIFARIEKSEELEDGTLLVTGLASDDTVDSDAQIADPEWLKTAMPDWFKWGNIREMHGAKAAGVATELEQVGEAAHRIVAHVVDPVSVDKVKNKVLKGFSIGIRQARVVKDTTGKAAGGRIVDGKIVEVSLVDRPANPNCTLTLAKAAKPGMTVKGDEIDMNRLLVKTEELAETPGEPEIVPEATLPDPEGVSDETAEKSDSPGSAGDDLAADAAYLAKAWLAEGIETQFDEIVKRSFSAAQRREAAASGAAMSDGSFPIHNEEDLHNAIRLAGNAKNPEAARRHIMERARSMGMSSAIPDTWHDGHNKMSRAELEKRAAAVILSKTSDTMTGQVLGWLLSIDSIVDNGLKILSADQGVPNPDVDEPGSIYRAAGTSPENPSASGGGLVTINKADLQKSVASVLDQALAPFMERLERLEKAPTPGGPARTRPTSAVIVSHKGDELLAEIAQLDALAKTIGEPDVAKVYREQAARLRSEYSTLMNGV